MLLAKLRRMQFGRKSERLQRQIEQLELRLEELESNRSEKEPNAPVLEYLPASFVVIRHVRTKLSCTKYECIVQAEAPSRPIERGLVGPGLLAHVLVSKYCDHQPLYRQSEIYAREGVELKSSRL